MKLNLRLWLMAVLLSTVAQAQPQAKPLSPDDSDARPPVTQADLRIVQRAREILDSPAREPGRHAGLSVLAKRVAPARP